MGFFHLKTFLCQKVPAFKHNTTNIFLERLDFGSATPDSPIFSYLAISVPLSIVFIQYVSTISEAVTSNIILYR